MKNSQQTLLFAGRALGLSLLLASGGRALVAQQTSADAPTPAVVNLQAALSDDAQYSSSADQMAMAETKMDFVSALNATQPPPRYGRRPRYRGGNTNADGSNKYAFIAGAGFTQPVGNTYHYYKPSYSFQVGAGRNFSNQFGLLFQFDWDNLGVNNRALEYFSYTFTGDPNPGDNALSGNAHLWSFTLDPVYNITPQRGGLGAYLVGGVGFYHKNTQFTTPQAFCGFDPYYGYVCYAANASFPGGTYNSNSVGFNGGLGFTYKVSRFSNERLYGEVRYVVTLNQSKSGATLANAAAYQGTNFFPINSNRTTYLPVKFGVRF